MKKNFEIETVILNSGIIPLLTCSDINLAINLSQAICKSSCKLIEYGIREENAISNYCKLKKYLDDTYEDVYFGAGSITDLKVAENIIDIGTDFIIGPGFSEEISTLCNNKGILYIPGCATVTEILRAKSFGVSLFKIFPSKQLGGVQYLKSIKAALPWLKAIPAGGIECDLDSLKEWINAGAVAVTIGSNLFGKYKENDCFLKLENYLSFLLTEISSYKQSKN